MAEKDIRKAFESALFKTCRDLEYKMMAVLNWATEDVRKVCWILLIIQIVAPGVFGAMYNTYQDV